MQRFFFDIFPIIIFFAIYKFFGIYAATASAIVVSLLQVVYTRIRHRKFDKMQVATLVLIGFFGGATLIFHNPLFIKWKVSVLYWLFAVAILGSHYIGKRPLVQRMLGEQIKLPTKIWHRLSWSWFVFFAAVGFINLYVMFHYSTNTWVDFKLFGILGLTVLFFLGQGIYLIRHVKEQ